MKYLMLVFLIFAVSCSEIDVNTFSNYLEVQNEHLRLEWLLDLEAGKLDGIVEFNFRFKLNAIQKITLDIYKMDIHSVTSATGAVYEYFIDFPEKDSDQGQRLNINLGKAYNIGDSLKLRVSYSVDDRSRALSFMTKEQTATGTHPYLFSQCEDANCRSLAPLQDTPAIKQTYEAVVLWENKWSKDINVFMSAELVDNTKPLMGDYGTKKLSRRSFELKTKIPSYLISIVAGNVVKKPTSSGGRTFVISEDNSKLNEYVFELQDMEYFIQSLEKYIGPYTWGTYTIVVLPPSFPFGAMENPLLTFASPNMMVGDGSRLYVAIHEMAHSWFGNTVTCVNWSNMWMNEGFTVFLERKGSLTYYSQQLGQDKAKSMYYIAATTGNSSMYEEMLDFGLDNSFSSLHPDTTGVNPDESMSEVPYEKGFQLLTHLESIIGEEQFQILLQQYVAYYKWQSVDENDFYTFMTIFVSNQPDANNKLTRINQVYKNWVYQPGLPPIKLDFSTPAISQAQALAAAYIKAAGSAVPEGPATWNNFLPTQKHIFTQYLIDHSNQLTTQILNQLDNSLSITQAKDYIVKSQWFRACLLIKDQSRNDYIVTFLSTMGNRYVSSTVYSVFKDVNLALARQTFQNAIKFYHPLTRVAIQAILYPDSIQE